jgi:hypothetical protein
VQYFILEHLIVHFLATSPRGFFVLASATYSDLSQIQFYQIRTLFRQNTCVFYVSVSQSRIRATRFDTCTFELF